MIMPGKSLLHSRQQGAARGDARHHWSAIRSAVVPAAPLHRGGEEDRNRVQAHGVRQGAEPRDPKRSGRRTWVRRGVSVILPRWRRASAEAAVNDAPGTGAIGLSL